MNSMLDLYVPLMMLSIFSCVIGHMYSFFREVSIQILCLVTGLLRSKSFWPVRWLQRGKVLAAQAWQSDFNPWNPCKSRKRTDSKTALWPPHVRSGMHTHIFIPCTHIHDNTFFKDLRVHYIFWICYECLKSADNYTSFTNFQGMFKLGNTLLPST